MADPHLKFDIVSDILFTSSAAAQLDVVGGGSKGRKMIRETLLYHPVSIYVQEIILTKTAQWNLYDSIASIF